MWHISEDSLEETWIWEVGIGVYEESKLVVATYVDGTSDTGTLKLVKVEH